MERSRILQQCKGDREIDGCVIASGHRASFEPVITLIERAEFNCMIHLAGH